MERLESASLECVFEGSTGDVAVCRYPSTATYATNLGQQHATGSASLHSNRCCTLHDYDVRVTLEGYQPHIWPAMRSSNASPGDVFDLGEIFLYPADSNTNQIDDLWEIIHFGGSVDAAADADGDRVCNRDEYVAGTDPTNAPCCLNLTSSLSGK